MTTPSPDKQEAPMDNLRIIIKQTIQPPIDTPASVRWHTVDLRADALADLLNGVGISESDYSVFEVVGAELLPNRKDGN